MEIPRAASIKGNEHLWEPRKSVFLVFGCDERVSLSAHAGPKLLAATGRLLLASPRLAWNLSRPGESNILDAARIRTNPKALPGLLAGVRAGRSRVAGDCIRQARIRAATPCGLLSEACSFASDRAPLAFTPFGQTFLRARVSTHPQPAFRRGID
jgi:hypothetical protein